MITGYREIFICALFYTFIWRDWKGAGFLLPRSGLRGKVRNRFIPRSLEAREEVGEGWVLNIYQGGICHLNVPQFFLVMNKWNTTLFILIMNDIVWNDLNSCKYILEFYSIVMKNFPFLLGCSSLKTSPLLGKARIHQNKRDKSWKISTFPNKHQNKKTRKVKNINILQTSKQTRQKLNLKIPLYPLWSQGN